MLDRLHAAVDRESLAQLIRYVFVGLFVTALGAAIYYGCAEFLHIEPLLANLIAFAFGVVVGYILHSSVSFRGYGQRDDPARTWTRFIAVNLFGLGLNSFWVWTLVHWAHGPNWWPIVPMIFLTPLATFSLHRQWTFG
jgi:putative flippase GtrA